MTINYVLFENNLTSDPNDYMAIVQPTGTADLDDIIERIMDETVMSPENLCDALVEMSNTPLILGDGVRRYQQLFRERVVESGIISEVRKDNNRDVAYQLGLDHYICKFQFICLKLFTGLLCFVFRLFF